jgi:hypothetical protein
MKMCFLIFLPIAVSGSAWAQPLSQVQQFLQLSDSQLQTILTNNDDYNRWSGDKQNRIRQVQTEIADETRKSPLDPNALGIRYAEIETICREMKDRANESRTQNIGVLNQDQKSKLKILDDALKLAPVISDAQFGNLIGGLTFAPSGFTSSSIGYGGLLNGGVVPRTASLCRRFRPLRIVPEMLPLPVD